MTYFEWSDDLCVKQDDMDNQHKKLIGYVNEFYDAAASSASHGQLVSIFKKIIDFTTYHFAEEEALMAAAAYPDLKKHQFLHQKLVSRVLELKASLEANDPEAPKNAQQFLKFWLVSHIKGIDMNYAGKI